MPCEENLAVTRNAEVFNQVVLVLADWVFFDFGALFSLRIISSHFLPVTIGLLHEKHHSGVREASSNIYKKLVAVNFFELLSFLCSFLFIPQP